MVAKATATLDQKDHRTDTDCFLGVEKSLKGKRWIKRDADDRQALALAQRYGLPEVVGRVLAGRGVGLDDAEAFLNPTLRTLLPDPSTLKGMDVAAERLGSAIMEGEAIGIFGDYDVDGATSSALLKRFIAAVGGRTQVYIPDRIKEGYGPNTPALIKFKDDGISVVVTVDCGTSAFEPLEAAKDAGLEMIVVDHHEAEATLPPATAIINPNRLDDDSGQGQLAAVGVSFLLIHEWRANPDAGVVGGNVLLGIGLALLGILAASFANVVQANPTGRAVPMVSLLAWAMLYGTTFDLGFAWITAGPPPFPTEIAYWGGIVYLALIGSVVTFPLHYNLVREIGAGRTAYNSIMTISVAMLLSTLFEDYRWTWLTASGMGLAVIGMLIALRARTPRPKEVRAEGAAVP